MFVRSVYGVVLLAVTVLCLLAFLFTGTTLLLLKAVTVRVRRTVLVTIIGAILLFPTLLFLLKDSTRKPSSKLFRREFVTLVALDVAITQHFFVVVGYSVTAVLFSAVGSTVTGTFVGNLQAWVTLGGVGNTDTSGWVSFLLGGYGMIGIALLVSLIITTYSDIVDEFPRTTAETKQYISKVIYDSTVDVDDISLDEMPEDVKRSLVKSMVGDSIEDVIEKGYLGNPTFSRMWTWLRNR